MCLISSSVSSVGRHFPLVKPSLLRRGSSSNEVAIWHNQLTEQLPVVFLCAWQSCGGAGVLCAPCQDEQNEQQTAGLAPRERQQQFQETCRAEPITDTRGINSADLTCSSEKVVENIVLILQTPETFCWMKALLSGLKLFSQSWSHLFILNLRGERIPG